MNDVIAGNKQRLIGFRTFRPLEIPPGRLAPWTIYPWTFPLDDSTQRREDSLNSNYRDKLISSIQRPLNLYSTFTFACIPWHNVSERCVYLTWLSPRFHGTSTCSQLLLAAYSFNFHLSRAIHKQDSSKTWFYNITFIKPSFTFYAAGMFQKKSCLYNIVLTQLLHVMFSSTQR